MVMRAFFLVLLVSGCSVTRKSPDEGPWDCETDDDCPAGLICEESDGSWNCEEPPCTLDDECAGDLVCEDGYCQPPPCTRDAECPDVLCY